MSGIIFITVGSMRLCFGFVAQTVLITEGWFCYFWALSQDFFCFSPHQWAGSGCTRSWEGTQPGQVTSTDQRDIPGQMMPFSAYEWECEEGRRGDFRQMTFVFLTHHYMTENFSAGDVWMPACRWEQVNEFFVLLCLHMCLLLFLIKLFVSTAKFSHFYPSILSPISLVTEWVSGCMELSWGWMYCPWQMYILSRLCKCLHCKHMKKIQHWRIIF